MEPVRVKVYGLMSMTRRGYLVQWSLAVVLAGGLLVLWLVRWPAVREKLLAAGPSPLILKMIAFWDVALWILGGISLLLPVEAWIVLRCFARKEAERKRQQTPGPA